MLTVKPVAMSFKAWRIRFFDDRFRPSENSGVMNTAASLAAVFSFLACQIDRREAVSRECKLNMPPGSAASGSGRGSPRRLVKREQLPPNRTPVVSKPGLVNHRLG